MCQWCGCKDRSYKGHCFECYAQGVLERFGYPGRWKEYATALDLADSTDRIIAIKFLI